MKIERIHQVAYRRTDARETVLWYAAGRCQLQPALPATRVNHDPLNRQLLPVPARAVNNGDLNPQRRTSR